MSNGGGTPGSFLEGVSEYLHATERAPGVLYCDKHRIEHTGTGAYAAMLDSYIHSPGSPPDRLQFAKRVVMRVVSRISRDPGESYIAYIIPPGSRDPHNHANNAIDCGCGIDALATFGRLHRGLLTSTELDSLRDAVRKVCDTYIIPHARPKEILAQRMWSVAALGSAFQWLSEPSWKEAGLEAVSRTLLQQNPDGSFPYTPVGTPRSHPGSADASAFYHSRHTLFLAHAIESFGGPLRHTQFEAPLRAACEFLLALRRAGGLKTTRVEAKPWYWESNYEVAGFGFDISSLLICGRMLDEPQYLHAAAEMFQQCLRHVEPDRGITSHRGAGWNFQCRFFWNAHLAWIARERETLQTFLDANIPPAALAPRLSVFPNAGLARYSDDRIVAILRGAAPVRNMNHGSPFGGGGLLHLASHAEPGRERIKKTPSSRHPDAEWIVVPQGNPGWIARIRNACAQNRDELRFLLWIARVRARSGDVAGAVAWYWKQWKRGVFEASRIGYSSATATICEMQHVERSLAFRSGVADPFGKHLPGVTTVRRYNFERGRVRVGDAIITERAISLCMYKIPEGAGDVAADGPGVSTGRGMIQFRRVPPGSTIAVRFSLSAGC